MNIQFLNQNEKNKITEKLKEQFGIEKIPFNLIKIGQERIMAISEKIKKEEIEKIQNIAFIEGIGVYFAKEIENEIRLSIEGTHLLKEQISKNIFELNEKQAEQWMQGNELNLSTGKKGFIIIKFNDDFLGTGKASENKIGNFIPKNRRLKAREFNYQYLQ